VKKREREEERQIRIESSVQKEGFFRMECNFNKCASAVFFFRRIG
jgi:hypothetical protein